MTAMLIGGRHCWIGNGLTSTVKAEHHWWVDANKQLNQMNGDPIGLDWSWIDALNKGSEPLMAKRNKSWAHWMETRLDWNGIVSDTIKAKLVEWTPNWIGLQWIDRHNTTRAASMESRNKSKTYWMETFLDWIDNGFRKRYANYPSASPNESLPFAFRIANESCG